MLKDQPAKLERTRPQGASPAVGVNGSLHDSLYCRMPHKDGNPRWIRGRVKLTETQPFARHVALDHRKTILIADDSAMVRTIIRQALERDTEFVVCGEASNGTEAVSKAKELSPDLIILDVMMPGLNGIEVAGILRYAQPKPRIVLVTMHAEDLEKNFASYFHIDAVTSKANGLTELTALVAGLLAEKQLDCATPGDTLTAI